MAPSELVVDGTNVAWAWPRARPLLLRRDHAGAQGLLVEAAWRSRLRSDHAAITFVFDGPAPSQGPGGAPGLRVLYPEPGTSADQRILEVVAQLRHSGAGVLVASSDRGLRELVRGLGGNTVGAQALLLALDPRQSGSRDRDHAAPAPPGKPLPSRRDTEEWLRQFQGRRTHKPPPQKTGDSR
ncbi:MAG: NYN domain-containing protein [Candidatus Dormibacteria bacterium]